MKKFLIAGNWKMNTTPKEAGHFIGELKTKLIDGNYKFDILVCPPFTSLYYVKESAAGTIIKIGAQNCHPETKGAFTGEVSIAMLKDIEMDYVIIGHSERRKIFLETDDFINQKVIAALNHGITPILCIGETIEERNNNQTYQVLEEQISKAYQNIPASDLEKIVIAYEPVWAIGTGISATSEQAEEAHKWIREFLKNNYGDSASQIRILYGGSMNEKNAEELLSLPNVDGGLIGGASLKADSFYSIIESAKKLSV